MGAAGEKAFTFISLLYEQESYTKNINDARHGEYAKSHLKEIFSCHSLKHDFILPFYITEHVFLKLF